MTFKQWDGKLEISSILRQGIASMKALRKNTWHVWRVAQGQYSSGRPFKGARVAGEANVGEYSSHKAFVRSKRILAFTLNKIWKSLKDFKQRSWYNLTEVLKGSLLNTLLRIDQQGARVKVGYEQKWGLKVTPRFLNWTARGIKLSSTKLGERHCWRMRFEGQDQDLGLGLWNAWYTS